MNKLNYLFLLFFMVATLTESLGQERVMKQFEWNKLAAIPDKIGFAGSYAGVANGALIFAGGANFPDGGAPWIGSSKAWSDRVFALEKSDGQWKEVGKLPQRLGYGVSINYKKSLVLLGGSNETGHHSSVMMLHYRKGVIEIDSLPDLPEPIANTCGVILGDVIYVMGGIITPDAKTAGTNFWALDLASAKKEWQVLKTWPGEGRMLSVAGAQNDAVYLFSGVALIDGKRKYITDAFKYTPKIGWEKIADLPYAVAAAPTPAFSFNQEKLIIFGGDDGAEAANAANLKENHPGFSKQILGYNYLTNGWTNEGEVFTDKKEDSVSQPNHSIWAPVTTTLTVWKGKVVLPGGEVRPATRTPNVLVAMPIKSNN